MNMQKCCFFCCGPQLCVCVQIVYVKPPWSLDGVLKCFKKHWIAVFGIIIKRSLLSCVEMLSDFLCSSMYSFIHTDSFSMILKRNILNITYVWVIHVGGTKIASFKSDILPHSSLHSSLPLTSIIVFVCLCTHVILIHTLYFVCVFLELWVWPRSVNHCCRSMTVPFFSSAFGREPGTTERRREGTLRVCGGVEGRGGKVPGSFYSCLNVIYYTLWFVWRRENACRYIYVCAFVFEHLGVGLWCVQ